MKWEYQVYPQSLISASISFRVLHIMIYIVLILVELMILPNLKRKKRDKLKTAIISFRSLILQNKDFFLFSFAIKIPRISYFEIAPTYFLFANSQLKSSMKKFKWFKLMRALLGKYLIYCFRISARSRTTHYIIYIDKYELSSSLFLLQTNIWNTIVDAIIEIQIYNQE